MMVRDTSVISYRDIKSQLGGRQKVVLDVIRYLGRATNVEISSYLGLPINTITPRTNELVKKCLVCDVGKKECAITGRMAYVWRVK